MENYDILVVDRPTYARALAEVKRADPPPHPIAKAIVSALTTLETLMHDEETGCTVCDGDGAYVFAVKEPPPEFLCCVPAEGSNVAPIAVPICEKCARLSDAAKAVKIGASMARSFPGSRTRKPN